MQGALVARSLYPPEHPRIRSCEERAAKLLHEVLEQRDEVTLFALGDRVIFDGEILSASSSLTDTLFHMLHQRGVDQLTFRRGLGEAELSTFLDSLDDGDASEESSLSPTAHLMFGFLKQRATDEEEDAEPSSPSYQAPAYAEQAADVLPSVWHDLNERKQLNVGLLGDIVSCISKVIDDSSDAMLPLAPLKRRDEYTFTHTINVAVLSTSFGEALGFDPQAAHELSIAALLHDVGKQVIPKEILDKQGRLSEEEFRIMQTHPIEGARFLLNTPGVPELAPIVAYEHHVRFDGSGYPKVPRGWKLNLASRIIQMADVFDALRTTRPYREGLPIPKVVEVMRHDVGVFFDSDLLKIFFEQVVSRGIPDPAEVAS
jgi:HD-GYP domain-containing protein (c-di-GMP phosphodiesterase class II)